MLVELPEHVSRASLVNIELPVNRSRALPVHRYRAFLVHRSIQFLAR